ncbi:MAG TPA: CPBP family glutamic-type intramembrane protease [Anaerolineales bacterium]
MTKSAFNWKLFSLLLAGAVLGLIAIVPYSLALQGDAAVAAAAAQANMPLWLLITIQLATQVITFGVATWVGLSFASSVGLGSPILQRMLAGERVWLELRKILPISILLGVVLALLLIGLEVLVFQPALIAELGENALAGASAVKPAAWKGFLASFYGGINEEILLRLCVMSFLAWLGRFVSRTADGKPTMAVLWIANILAAVLFGLGHLPATAALVPLTPLVVARAIVLNGIIGIGFGYLYFKHGLESAMISHFSADIVLHVLFAI